MLSSSISSLSPYADNSSVSVVTFISGNAEVGGVSNSKPSADSDSSECLYGLVINSQINFLA
ncbi:MAG: hypothetical protein ACOCSL_02355 [Thermoplasmatota archaeon]